MNFRRVATAAVFMLAGSAIIASVHAQMFSVTPDQLKWAKSAATLSESAVIMGDPRQPGPFVTRARYKEGMKVMPHSHPGDVYLTVLSGTLLYAEGETFDESKFKEFPAGSFLVERANVPHYAMAKTAVVFQAAGTGPAAFKYVNPQHDPRNK
jgi:quercetin dioxygenase-like cupin family protein